MFSKVLIANRGEIAVRVIRACKELGISTVAVYSDLDRDALHVRLADEAFALGGQTAAESYIDTAKLLDVIKRSGADAVHPGYGFFSENSDFAKAISEMGVAFIGPGPDAIDVMGDKISARLAAERVGVNGVPGTTDLITDAQQIRDFGNEFGYPIAIKAAYGGGGRGMKVVNGEDEAQAALESAQREALAYFGRDECYMERYLTKPRHIEVQLIADSHGNCVYVGTRDCSAQRRHQKLIEESPAPGLDPAELARTLAAAVRACQQIDLVELQLRVASGEPLGFTQDDIDLRGHAIEVRINAEDPAQGKFLPSPGKITELALPSGLGVRWDGGYEAGDEISQYYDNLVGKLCVWGKDRPTAIARMIRALNEMTVGGVATTIPADLAILEHPDFAALEHSTKWVENTLDLSNVGAPAVAADDSEAEEKVRRDVQVEVNGRRFDVALWMPASAMAGSGAAPARPKPKRASGGGSAAAGSGKIAVPMQGTIVKVEVEVGQHVAAGDTVCVLEAMKMENNIAADIAGTVAEINVAVGQSVTNGEVVIVIAPEAAAE